MKIVLTSFAFVLILLQLFPWSSPPEKPKQEQPVKGWWIVSYFAVPSTRYSRAAKGIIKAESLGSRASLFKKVQDKEADYFILTWKWKISNVVCSAIETRKDRFDTAARVMVVFGDRSSLKLMEGGEPAGFRIEYIWATRLPQGQIFDHPGERNCKVFVLESGEKKVGQWISEKRNIYKDFETAFGAQPTGVLAIGIQTDTDHSNEMVTAYYSEPLLKKK